jgi:hypothetical protein
VTAECSLEGELRRGEEFGVGESGRRRGGELGII